MRKWILSYGLTALSAVFTGGMAYGADALVGQLKASACVGCHGNNGIGLSDELPNLAGQKQTYLKNQLKAFRDRSRINPTMNAMAASLSDEDIDALSSYFSELASADTPSLVAGMDLNQSKLVRSQFFEKPRRREFTEEVFISMKKSATVQVFPHEETWQGGPNMLYTAVTPDGKRVLATSPSENTVYVFDSAKGDQLAVIPVGKAPKGVKVSPDGRQAYVSNQGSAEVSVIDLERLAVVNSIKVAEGPHNARFTRDGKLAYVTLQGGAGIGVINTAEGEMIRVIPVPGITGPHNLDLSLDEKTAFVRDFVHHVAVLDLEAGEVKKVITVGNGHGGIDVTPDGRYAVTAAIGDTRISVIDTETLNVRHVNVGNGPHGIRASLDGRWIYTSLTKDNAIAVVDTATMEVDRRFASGEFPFWVAVRGNP